MRPQLTDRRRLGRVGPHRVRRNRLCRPTISQRRRLEHTLTVTGNCANVIGGAGITIKFDRVDKQIDLKTSPPMWTATPGTGGLGSGKKIRIAGGSQAKPGVKFALTIALASSKP